MKYSKNQAFTILELTIVLAIIAIMLGNMMIVNTEKDDAAMINETNLKMDRIEKAMADYLSYYSAIPCPAILIVGPWTANFGVANVYSTFPTYCSDNTVSTLGAASSPWYASSGIELGSVPTKALQLPDNYAFDAWGRRFTYVMVQYCNQSTSPYLPTMTGYLANPTNYYPYQGFLSAYCGESAGNYVTILNKTGGTTIASNAVFVLVSHGKNGHGAYSYDGTVRINSANAGTDEIVNAQFTNAGATSLNTRTFIQRPLQMTTIGSTGYFDDIVRFKTRQQLVKDAGLIYNTTSATNSTYANSGNEICGLVSKDIMVPLMSSLAYAGCCTTTYTNPINNCGYMLSQAFAAGTVMLQCSNSYNQVTFASAPIYIQSKICGPYADATCGATIWALAWQIMNLCF